MSLFVQAILMSCDAGATSLESCRKVVLRIRAIAEKISDLLDYMPD